MLFILASDPRSLFGEPVLANGEIRVVLTLMMPRVVDQWDPEVLSLGPGDWCWASIHQAESREQD